MTDEPFGKNLHQLRKQHGMTMQDVASKLGISRGTVCMWETQGIVPRKDTLIALSHMFQVSVDVLLGNRSSETEDKLTAISLVLSRMDDNQLDKATQLLELVFPEAFQEGFPAASQ